MLVLADIVAAEGTTGEVFAGVWAVVHVVTMLSIVWVAVEVRRLKNAMDISMAKLEVHDDRCAMSNAAIRKRISSSFASEFDNETQEDR